MGEKEEGGGGRKKREKDEKKSEAIEIFKVLCDFRDRAESLGLW